MKVQVEFTQLLIMYQNPDYGGEAYFQKELKGIDVASFEKKIKETAKNPKSPPSRIGKNQSLSVKEQHDLDRNVAEQARKRIEKDNKQ
ncbi:hypothetical protein NQ117_07050 [Paenibacillus sp. SC116]|uniref:hypothetical protein n=1 Tax=Paenibacillus sp. SC116 TaxID=2968986 RepID=UPI00215B5B69|nr:hypothetical protein [Paenibacillus sp. SC116]MCR8843436.1 hypothetical protein [Paenibacillus sp. SC116]